MIRLPGRCTALATIALAGCATQPPMYYWGSYQPLIYQSYHEPGSVPPERQIEQLERDFQQARAKNVRMPPGWHAHLGVQYFKLGKVDEAVRELRTEKAEFPESAVFVDRLLANIGKTK